MKRLFIFVGVLLVFNTCFASNEPIEATTSDGKKVLLSSDGSWKYQETKALESKSQGGLTKPKNATEVMKSDKGFLNLWYDSAKWKAEREPAGSTSEFTLTHVKGDGYVMAIIERIEIPLNNLKKIALDNALEAAPDAKVVLEEKKVVNGVEVLAMDIQGTIQNIPFRYHGYYWSGKKGSLQLITYTAQNLFDEYKQDFDELLNGVVITE